MTRSRPWLTALLQTLILLAFVATGSPWLAAEEAPIPVSRRAGDVRLHGHQVRPVFNGSIVPGGVYSPGELRAAIEHDPVVAAHYRAADLERMHAVTLTQGKAAYVSYRVGGRVYWTRDRVWLKAGETVLTDGTTTIRARCGNCVSDVKQHAVSAVEPAPGELDDFVVPPTPDRGVDAFAADAEPALGDLLDVPFGPEALAFVAPGGGLLIPQLTAALSGDGGVSGFFVPPIIVAGGSVGGGDTTFNATTGTSSTGSPTGSVSQSSGDATTSSSGATPAPEPELLWLVASGVIAVASRRLRAK